MIDLSMNLFGHDKYLLNYVFKSHKILIFDKNYNGLVYFNDKRRISSEFVQKGGILSF